MDGQLIWHIAPDSPRVTYVQCFEQTLRDFAPTTLGVWIFIREYSSQIKFNKFLLNDFQLDRFPTIARFEYSRMQIYIPKVLGAKLRNVCSPHGTAVGNSPHFGTYLHFRHLPQHFKPELVVDSLFHALFATWLQKIVACEAMCCFFGMLWSFVTALQDDYNRSLHPRKPTHRLACYYILQSCYKRSQHPRKINTSPRMLLSFVQRIVAQYVMCSAVGNSSPFLNESPFQPIRQNGQPRIQLKFWGKWPKWRFAQKMGRVADGWMCWLFGCYYLL